MTAALAPEPSAGQQRAASSDGAPSLSWSARADIRRSDAAFRDLVACVVRLQPLRARNLLDTIPGSYAEIDIYFTFQARIDTCFDWYRFGGRGVTFDSRLLRGAIAESFLRQEYPGGIAAADADAETTAAWTTPRSRDGRVTDVELAHAMARCVIVREPAEVNRLLRSEPLGSQEAIAFRRLQSPLSACLDSGVQLAASRQILRGLLAEAALHYGEASRNGFVRVGRGDPRGDDE